MSEGNLSTSWIEVSGTSMWPFLKPGDRVEVEWFTGELSQRPRLGDIVFLQGEENRWIVHRITGMFLQMMPDPQAAEGTSAPEIIPQLYLQVKGDASVRAETVPADRAFGRVRRIQRGMERSTSGPMRNNWMDRWIAFFSQYSQEGVGLGPWLRRRMSFVGIGTLGVIRRILL